MTTTSNLFRGPFHVITKAIEQNFLAQPTSESNSWQSQDVSSRPEMQPRELANTTVIYDLPRTHDQLIAEVEPNLPWAFDHFQERVSGMPFNPPPSEKYWPYAQQGNAAHKAGEKFSHTYPERFWPKYANQGETRPNGRQVFVPHNGIRYEYGDLEDLVNQLINDPTTRQAYLPVWFPEDTGAVHGQRVPCTLGYHFMVRGHELTITYYIRSCDYIRHFRDDVYMAARLAEWVAHQMNVGMTQGAEVRATGMVMHIANFHVFEGDVPALRNTVKIRADKAAQTLADKVGWL